VSRGYGDYDDDGENFPNEYAFWVRRRDQVLSGKRGRSALAELREALMALPEKRLVMGAISTVSLADRAATLEDDQYLKRDILKKCAHEGPGVCAIGAYLWHKAVKAGADPEQAFHDLPVSADVLEEYLGDTARIGETAGLSYTLAYLLASRNDESYEDYTPEIRYQKFMGWLDQVLEPVPS
jgi:hypothetical protein